MTANEEMTLYDNLSLGQRKQILKKAWDDEESENTKNQKSINLCWDKQQKIKVAASELNITI